MRGIRAIALLAALVSISDALAQVKASKPAAASRETVVEARLLGAGTPVPGVTIKWVADGNLKGAGKTDADGKYSFAGLSDQTSWLTLKAHADGMTPLDMYWNRRSGQAAPGATTQATVPHRFTFSM